MKHKQLCSFLVALALLMVPSVRAQFVQQGSKLVGTGAVGTAWQGLSVSLSADGNTAIVGAWQDNGSVGAAWVYSRSGGVWTQQGSKLVGTGAVGSPHQGYSVSLSADGNTAIVGGYSDNGSVGAAWVYTRSGGVWTQQGSKFVGTGAVGSSYQGYSVSLSADGNTAIVGGYNDNSSAGAAWVYTRSGGVWTQQGSKLVGTGAGGSAEQGTSVSLSSDGNTAIIGALADNGYAGAAWVYTRSGGVWAQQGSKLVGTAAVGIAEQGISVSLSADGNTAIVGGVNDNSSAGAVWEFTRNGTVWTQQGNKLVGTGAVGNASQGYAVAVSADGNTIIVGGVSDNAYAGAAWVYSRSILTINSISDIPNDQGARVGVKWNKFLFDSAGISPQVSSYSIWRALPGSQVLPSTIKSSVPIINSEGKTIRHFTVNGVDSYWELVGSQPALLWPQYGYTAPTLFDSTSPANNGMESFIVVAQTGVQNVFYVSNVDSGYSVDNIPPIPPAGLVASVQAGPQVKLTWNQPTDPDVGSYSIYRSTTSGFIPSGGNLIGTANSINFTDANPLPGDLAYYRIIAVDVHGNQSVPSAQASVGIAVSQEFSIQDKWNMVSVPLSVSDFSKTALYPTATSNAFGYAGSYFITPTLATGTGYWLKFNGAQNANLTGLLLTNDTINVTTGWNMIGSLSQPIAVSSVSSIPGGITTSRFFGYQGSYAITDSIHPGKGYWVKVNQDGKLVLSSSSQATPSTAIRIVPAEEHPPAPPEANDMNLRTIPISYALEQNYPNPFNPTTIITYALPEQAFVRLTVYNVLGQEVATLVNEMQDAGSRSMEFNSNNLPSGLYFYKITAGTFSDMKKMILLK